MKVCHFTSVHNRYDPRIFEKQCKSLKSFGFEVNLIVADGLGNKIEEGINIIDVGVSKSRLHRFFVIGYRIYKTLKRIKADIYEFHDPELILFALLFSRINNKVIYDIHEDNLSFIKQKHYLIAPIKRMLWFAMKVIENLAYKSFNTIIAEKYYERRFPKSVKILNYPKNLKISFVDRSKELNTKKLLYTGNIIEDRGAIQMAGLVKEYKDIEISCIGKCRLDVAERLSEVVGFEKDRLYIEGIGSYTKFERIVEYYSMDCWVAGLAIFPPSLHYVEKELTKFFEYMACGLPIIASNFPVWKELIEKTETGITVDPYNNEEIYNAINYLYENPEVRYKMGENGKKAIENIYNWEKEAEKLKELYTKIINNG